MANTDRPCQVSVSRGGHTSYRLLMDLFKGRPGNVGAGFGHRTAMDGLRVWPEPTTVRLSEQRPDFAPSTPWLFPLAVRNSSSTTSVGNGSFRRRVKAVDECKESGEGRRSGMRRRNASSRDERCMIFQRKVWAIHTSNFERFCVDERRIMIHEMDLIQQYYPCTPPKRS